MKTNKKLKKNQTKKMSGGGLNIPEKLKKETNNTIQNYILKMSKLKTNKNKLNNAQTKQAYLYTILDLPEEQLKSIACYKSIFFRDINKLLWYIGENGLKKITENSDNNKQLKNDTFGQNNNIFTLSNDENINDKVQKSKNNNEIKTIKEIYSKQKDNCINIFKAIKHGFKYDKPIIVFRNFTNILNIPTEINESKDFNGFM